MECLISKEDTFLNILHTMIFFSRSEGKAICLKKVCAELTIISYCFGKRMWIILVTLELSTMIHFRVSVIQFGV